MAQTLTLGLLRDTWLMHEPSLKVYVAMAADYLAGREVSTGFFSSLQLPDVPPSMAMIPMIGALTKANVCGFEGMRSMTMKVQQAAADKSISAIIMLSESCPGGQVDGTQELADAVRAARAKKPVIGAVSGMCCSAGVFVLSQADEVYATSETDFIGCIGVMGRMRNPKKADNPDADFIDVISDLSPEKNAESRDPQRYKEQQLNPLAKIFQQYVTEGRGGKLKLTREDVLSGKTYIANEARQYGLIDGVMSFNKIIGRADFLYQKRKKNEFSQNSSHGAGGKFRSTE